MTGLAVLAGEWRLKAEDRRQLNTIYLPWALRAGTRAADLMCIYYEKHLHVSAQQGCRALGLNSTCRVSCMRVACLPAWWLLDGQRLGSLKLCCPPSLGWGCCRGH